MKAVLQILESQRNKYSTECEEAKKQIRGYQDKIKKASKVIDEFQVALDKLNNDIIDDGPKHQLIGIIEHKNQLIRSFTHDIDSLNRKQMQAGKLLKEFVEAIELLEKI